ncbi:MAG TPA: hypothetical protein VFY28_01815 [Candidatus Paceibacterota bacterium]|nr:hypothetical protein [Candidatus Paceibacterota bacterium]
MRFLEDTIGPAPPALVTEATFSCGGECRSLGQLYDPNAVVRAGGASFCGNCKVNPSNQSHHVCVTRTQESHADWLLRETERLDRRRIELAAFNMAAE